MASNLNSFDQLLRNIRNEARRRQDIKLDEKLEEEKQAVKRAKIAFRKSCLEDSSDDSTQEVLDKK